MAEGTAAPREQSGCGGGTSSQSALSTSQGPSCCFQPTWVPQAEHNPVGSSSTLPSGADLKPRGVLPPGCKVLAMQPGVGTSGQACLVQRSCLSLAAGSLVGSRSLPPEGLLHVEKARDSSGPPRRLWRVCTWLEFFSRLSKWGPFHPPSFLCPTKPDANSSTRFFPLLGPQCHGRGSFRLPSRVCIKDPTCPRRRLWDLGIGRPSTSFCVDVRSVCSHSHKTEQGQHPVSHAAIHLGHS